MKNKFDFGFAILFFIIFKANGLMAWNDEFTHPRITEESVRRSILSDNLLKTIGIDLGKDEAIDQRNILNYLNLGSIQEDALDICRASNHFHDPLKPWYECGLTDLAFVSVFCTGGDYPNSRIFSNITWATGYDAPMPDEDKPYGMERFNAWGWDQAREYYYTYFTCKDFKNQWVVNTEYGRKFMLAKSFRAIGQVMHLLQDTAVPDHVKNDFSQGHLSFTGIDPPESFNYIWEVLDFRKWFGNKLEDYVKDKQKTGQPPWFTSACGGDLPNPAITDFWDTDQYILGSPNSELPADTVGLAEYTNINFLSCGKSFTEEYPYPNLSSTNFYEYTDNGVPTLLPEEIIAEDRIVDNLECLKKVRHGETGNEPGGFNLARPSYWTAPLGYETNGQITTLYKRSFKLDEACYEDYAALLIPRAIGYSKALIDYFFRGDINLKPDEDLGYGVIIENNTGENLEGTFELYYDDINGMRVPVQFNGGGGPWKFEDFSVNAASLVTCNNMEFFAFPQDAAESGKYVLVFHGTMGKEADTAVVGKVIEIPVIEISRPDDFVYSIVDGSDDAVQFTELNMKLRNPSSEKQLTNGTLHAVAMYKKRTNFLMNLENDPPSPESRESKFSYSVSQPISASAVTIENTLFHFDFSSEPIPVGITDLYLYVIFQSEVGEQTVFAMGMVDLKEPTHLCFFNSTDMFYLDHALYKGEDIAADPELADFFAQYCSNHNQFLMPYSYQEAKIGFYPDFTPLENRGRYNLNVIDLPPERYGRAVFLSDKKSYAVYEYVHSNSPAITYISGDTVTHDCAVNQNNSEGVLSNSVLYNFRGVKAHLWLNMLTHVCPDDVGLTRDLWPELTDKTPYDFTIIHSD